MKEDLKAEGDIKTETMKNKKSGHFLGEAKKNEEEIKEKHKEE